MNSGASINLQLIWPRSFNISRSRKNLIRVIKHRPPMISHIRNTNTPQHNLSQTVKIIAIIATISIQFHKILVCYSIRLRNVSEFFSRNTFPLGMKMFANIIRILLRGGENKIVTCCWYLIISFQAWKFSLDSIFSWIINFSFYKESLHSNLPSNQEKCFTNRRTLVLCLRTLRQNWHIYIY